MQDNQESYSVYCLPPKRDYPELLPNFHRTFPELLPMFHRHSPPSLPTLPSHTTKWGSPFYKSDFLLLSLSLLSSIDTGQKKNNCMQQEKPSVCEEEKSETGPLSQLGHQPAGTSLILALFGIESRSRRYFSGILPITLTLPSAGRGSRTIWISPEYLL